MNEESGEPPTSAHGPARVTRHSPGRRSPHPYPLERKTDRTLPDSACSNFPVRTSQENFVAASVAPRKPVILEHPVSDRREWRSNRYARRAPAKPKSASFSRVLSAPIGRTFRLAISDMLVVEYSAVEFVPPQSFIPRDMNCRPLGTVAPVRNGVFRRSWSGSTVYAALHDAGDSGERVGIVTE